MTFRSMPDHADAAPTVIRCQRALFDLPDDVAYLNCAYMSPLLKRAAAAGAAAIARKCRPFELQPGDFFSESERARGLFAELLGASVDDVAIIPAASYGLAVAAGNLPLGAGARIVVLAEQFPSNVYTWRELARRSGTEVLAVTRPEGDDWTAAAPGYKWLLGPYSLGYLYVAPAHQDGRPLEENWIGREGSEDFARLIDYQDRYQPGARRFDVGERSNFGLLPVSIVAMEQLLAWGVERIAATLRAKTTAIAERAAALGLSSAPADRRAGHFLGLRFPAGAPRGLPERLAEQRVYVSLRGDSLRVTPHVYNDDADVQRLFAVLEAML